MGNLLEHLSDIHRRRLLVALLDHDSKSDDSLVIPDDMYVGDGDKHRIYTLMVHHHCPRLEDAGVIRWDRVANTVQPGPQFEEIRPLLAVLNDNADDLPGEWV